MISIRTLSVRRSSFALALAAIALAATLPAAGPPRLASTHLPLYFVPNEGQLDLPAAYYAMGRGQTALFTSEGVGFVMPSAESATEAPRGIAAARRGIRTNPDAAVPPRIVALRFVDANRVEPAGRQPTGAVFSWFRGTPDEWKAGLPTYETIAYEDLWPGIDCIYTGASGRLKYSFELDPGADPSQVRLAYPPGSTLALDAQGGLSITTEAGTLAEAPPYAFQMDGDKMITVPIAFELHGPNEYGFRVGVHDPSLPLVLDPPTFVYAGFVGGIDEDRGLGIAVDSTGAAYLTGQVNTPTMSGFTYDMYVAKINPAGTALVYYDVFAGSNEDEGFDIAVDAAGNAYVVGATRSTNYPVLVGPDLAQNGDWDVLLSKINPSGSGLVYSGYLGGTGTDYAEGVAVDSSGNAYVEGLTSSNQHSFPATVGPDRSFNGGFYDTFIAKVKAVPSSTSVKRNLAYCGYIGGDDDDSGYYGSTNGHVAIDAAGAAYISGMTRSTEASFPNGRGFGRVPGFDHAHGGGYDAYVVKVEPGGGGLAYATYIGGSADDLGFGMKVDSAGNAYLTGTTESTQATFPVTVGPDLTYNGGDSQGGDAFVAKLNPGGTALAYCGYLGGSDVETGQGVTLDATGALYVIGYTESSEATFPAKGGPDLTFNGAGADIGDGFVCKVKPVPSDPNPVNNVDYCGYIGGSGNDLAFWIALDASGNAYICGDAESTEATFPNGNGMGGLPGWDQTQAGVYDAFVVKITP